ncbi:CAP-associated domain-containing protein [Vagococcus vulneris]|uniref:CAP-associated domain-containing protein n=1 Tax=Vagococcus vulneris TaxID=1977869 RepID=A0A430A174_9ENTE|nr:CAP-associated domain-containing protein [Vagococcus vulneris]RSU00148.1 hypothetical protein CBF37_02285 [Vagococcus vulneris]
MKRFWQFVICFSIVIVVVYMKPVLASRNTPPVKNKLDVIEESYKPANMLHNELNASGMALEIGTPEADWLKEHPNPTKTYQSAFDIKWLVYGSSLTDFYQVGISKGKVSNIFILGNHLDTDPFRIDMNLADLSEITTIFSTFKINFDNKIYRMELTEDDMNYRPLVSFNNGTFAMLHLNQTTGQLISIRYLDKETLLKLAPYPFDGINKYEPQLSDAIDWKVINEDNRQQTLQLLNLLRSRDHRLQYTFDEHLQSETTKSLDSFLEKPESVLDDEQNLIWADYQTKLSQSDIINFNEDMMNRLIKEAGFNKKNTHGLYYQPATDIPFMVSSLYGSRSYHEELLHTKDKYIGISFQKNSMLMFFSKQTPVETVKTEESSE